jgi:S-adenosylmethionine synthetase
VETLLTTGLVVVAGEVTTTGYVDVKQDVRDRILKIGYDSSVKGFDGHSCGVMVAIGGQSGDIAQGVDTGIESRSEESVDPMDKQGAGDQGLMFGYACDDTPELMPLPITIAHRLAERLSEVRRDGTMSYLRPDGKTQVTIEYDDEDRPVRVDTVVVSSQHAKDISLDGMLTPDVKKHVVDHVLATFDISSEGYRLLVNPTGRFEVGGPMGDAGLTGRKIIVDTYGGMARHGGGAFSGKDPSAARCRSPTRSARRSPSGSTSTASAPRRSRSPRSRRRSRRSSTCGPPPSSRTSTCCARSTSRPPPTATSGAPPRPACGTASPGSAPTASSS